MRQSTQLLTITLLALGLTACGGHKSSSRGSAAPPTQQGAQVVSITPGEGPDVGTNTIIVQTANLPGSFDPASDQVLLGGNALTGVSAVGTDALSGIAPAGSGTVDVVVVQGGVQASLSNAYTYRAAELVSLSPATGAAGSAVTIDTRFFAADFQTTTPQVSFGGVAAPTVTGLSGAVVQVTVPPGAGAVDVTLTANGQSATLTSGFTYGAGSGASSTDPIVRRGPENPGMLNVRPGAAGVVVGQVRVSSATPVTVTAFAVAGEGAIDEGADLGDVVLYHDQNGNGLRDAGEPQLGAGTAIPSNNGQVVVSGLSLDVGPGQSADVLIAVEVKASANVSDNISFRCDGAEFTAVRRGTATPVTVRGGAVTGVAQVVGADPPKTFNLAAAPTSPASTQVAADAAGVPVVALRATTTTGILDLHTLELQLTGSADLPSAVATAQLAVDRNADGLIGAGDTSLGTAVVAPDGRVRFNFHGQRLTGPGSTFDLVLALTLSGTAAANETIGVEVKHGGVFVHAYYDNGGQEITLTPSTITGATLTIGAPASALSVRVSDAAAAIAPAGAEALALTLDLTSGGAAAADVTAVTVHAKGSLDDATEVTAVALYADTNGDGLFSAGVDQRIAGPATFTADDGALTLTPGAAHQVGQASSARVFVTTTLAANVAAGKTVTLSLDPATDVASAPAAKGERAVGRLLVTGSNATSTGAFVQPGTDLGKDTYLRGEGLYLNDNFGHTNALSVGDRASGQLGERLFYIQFPLPQVPAGATIQRAYMAVYLAGTAGLTGPTLDVQVFQVVDSGARTPWLEGRGGFDASLDGIVFNGAFQSSNRPDLSRPDAAPTPVRELTIQRGSEGRWVLIDVTSAAQAWYAGTAANHGLLVRDKDFATHDDGAVSFYSSDYSKANLRPILLIER